MTGGCPDDEALERYSLGLCSAADEAALEEHLLVCGRCRARLRAAEDFIAVLRTAIQISSGRRRGSRRQAAESQPR
jgi:hypothetical protein